MYAYCQPHFKVIHKGIHLANHLQHTAFILIATKFTYCPHHGRHDTDPLVVAQLLKLLVFPCLSVWICEL